jgi:hypothetical protein
MIFDLPKNANEDRMADAHLLKKRGSSTKLTQKDIQ